MKIFKKLIAASMALVLSAGIFAGVSINADAAGKIPAAYIGEYCDSNGEFVIITETAESDDLPVLPYRLVLDYSEYTDLKVVVNDNTIPSVKADVALMVMMDLSLDGEDHPVGYYAFSFTDASHNVLKLTKYSRMYAYRNDDWTPWTEDYSCEYQRVSAEGQSAQDATAEPAAQDAKAVEEKTATPAQDAKAAETKPAKTTVAEAKKSYSSYSYNGTSAQELVNELFRYINTAEAGSTIEFTGKPIMMCYSQAILDKLAARGDVSLKTTFTYNGVTESFTIPAGSDYSNLEAAKYYGFKYLSNAFGGVEE